MGHHGVRPAGRRPGGDGGGGAAVRRRDGAAAQPGGTPAPPPRARRDGGAVGDPAACALRRPTLRPGPVGPVGRRRPAGRGGGRDRLRSGCCPRWPTRTRRTGGWTRSAPRSGAGCSHRPTPPPPSAWTRERLLPREFAPLALELLPRAGAGFVALGLAAWLLGDRRRPGELSTVMRSLPDNVTTEMDLALWRLAQDDRARTPAAPPWCGSPRPTSWRTATTPARCRPPCTGGCAAFLRRTATARSPRSTWACRAGRRTRRTCSASSAGYLRLDDDSAAPDAVFARGRLEAEEMVDTLADRAGGSARAAGAARPGPRPRARGSAGAAEVPPGDHARRGAPRAAHRRRRPRAARAARAQRTTCSSSTCARCGQCLAGVPFEDLVRPRRAEYARELRRRHVPRVLLSDGTEPEAVAERTPAARTGPCTAPRRRRARSPRGPRVVLDPHRARLEPGRDPGLPLHRPRLDAAVPHRRRAW